MHVLFMTTACIMIMNNYIQLCDVQVGTNGLLSFDAPYNSFSNQQFPISSRYLVAPFWDDVDIRGGRGEISYEIHTSGYYLDEVNTFLQRKRPSDFAGTWMAVIYYDAIHPYFGLSNPEVKYVFSTLILFQTMII